jgi:hypothetical protein
MTDKPKPIPQDDGRPWSGGDTKPAPVQMPEKVRPSGPRNPAGAR